MASTDDGAEEIILSLFSSLREVQTTSLAASIQSLEDKFDGPKGVIHFLLPRVWISTTDDASKKLYGDDALELTNPVTFIILTLGKSVYMEIMK